MKPRRSFTQLFAALAFGFAAPTFAAAAPSTEVQQEIRHLLGVVEKSGCEFRRDNEWHAPSKARAHLQRKYDYLVRKGLVSTSEQFIERAASASSLSGKPYRIRCDKGEGVPSAEWLMTQLTAYRKK